MRKHKIAVAGHLCLDLHPDLKSLPANALITPGKVFEIGNLGMGTGGSVSNTGISLFKLGVDTQLLTCVGDDMVSQMILESIAAHHPILIENIRILENQHGSYTMVFSPENQDRTLIHYPGTNENFGIEHIDFELLNETAIFHLGYPPLLPRLVNEEGFELELLYSKVKESGVVTSLDLSLPDPHGNTSSADWKKILKRVLPFVEIFLPSIEEIVFMLRKSDYLAWNGEVLPYITKRYMEDLADEILELGAAVSGFKLGNQGMYLKTSSDLRHFQNLETLVDVSEWMGVQLWQPAFQVEVQGTTGAGDSAYAGFLAELLQGSGPVQTLKMACAVGACNVEDADSVSGIFAREEMKPVLMDLEKIKKNSIKSYRPGE